MSEHEINELVDSAVEGRNSILACHIGTVMNDRFSAFVNDLPPDDEDQIFTLLWIR